MQGERPSDIKGLLPAGPSTSELPALAVVDSLPVIGMENLAIDDNDWGLDQYTQKAITNVASARS